MLGRTPIRVTEIGEFIRHNSCERRFKLGLNNGQIPRSLPFFQRLFNSLDPVLQEEGRKRENEWAESLTRSGYAQGHITVDSISDNNRSTTTWQQFIDDISTTSAGEKRFWREVEVRSIIGMFEITGRIDFIVLLWNNDQPKLRIVESKSSRRDRTYHRIQLVIYKMIIDRLRELFPVICCSHPLASDDFEYVVARIDEASNQSFSILGLAPLDLDMEQSDVERLTSDGGPLHNIVQTNLDFLSYEIDQKCDGCAYNVVCLPESARQRRLELISLQPSTIRVLQAKGVRTIDDLATLDLGGSQAIEIRNSLGFNENLQHLQLEAAARRTTLPGGLADPDTFPVQPLPNTGDGQLPLHELNGTRVVRVYLSVDYDYAENRVGALSAHVTTSDHQLYTGFIHEDNRWRPEPTIVEQFDTGQVDSDGRKVYTRRAVQGVDILKYVSSVWEGDYATDSGTEKEIVQSFFHELVDAIAEVAQANQAPIHFYVWSRSEMTRLVEACSRVSSRLLSHLRELLGCRESLEQLLFSSLQDEVHRRFGLGWTGRGLNVVSSLRWFGRSYHWSRTVNGQIVDLDRAFTQDLFDFKTQLDFMPTDGSWVRPNTLGSVKHRFEIRSRFNDSLPAAYWRAYWNTLPNPADMSLNNSDVANAILRYNEAAKPNYLRSYLRARVHALRWMEECVRFKNSEITKPPMDISQLKNYSLGVANAAQAGIDFLRLDHHVKTANWIIDTMGPPAMRVPIGRTIPLINVVSDQNRDIVATIDAQSFGLTLDSMEARSIFGQGAFVRLSPCSNNPQQGQTLRQLTAGGMTCRVLAVDWQTGNVTLAPMFSRPDTYTLSSYIPNPSTSVFQNATIDENVGTDFVAGKVEVRLRSNIGAYMHQWFDPEQPTVPAQQVLEEETDQIFRAFLSSFEYGQNPRRILKEDQTEAVMTGINTRVHLLQGPPGTGKTMTTAVAVLARILARHGIGNVIFVASHTHNAVDNLLTRIVSIADSFREHATANQLTLPPIHLLKVYSSNLPPMPTGGGITDIKANSSARVISKLRRTGVLVVGGTTLALLKFIASISDTSAYRTLPDGFQGDALVVDEASMMVFPHFLSLATMVRASGELMLAGDHRQLSPILSHDWEHEDRPPAQLYQPFASAYDAIQNVMRLPNIASAPTRVTYSALTFTFRLPPLIRDLIARLYRLDDIELEGLDRAPRIDTRGFIDSWESVWANDTGLYLVLHSERESRQSNETEAEIIAQIMQAAPTQTPAHSVAIITPHRAQRTLLQGHLSQFMSGGNAPIDVVDTVNRLQGEERSTVIVSATASDPAAISSSVEFILELNRANVAFSRTQNRLVVVCSESLVNHIPIEVDQYRDTLLWKSLRDICRVIVAEETVNGAEVRILTPSFEAGDGPYHSI